MQPPFDQTLTDIFRPWTACARRCGAIGFDVLRIFCLTLAATFLTIGPVLAQGLNVPAGSTVNVNSGVLNVAGSVTNAGTILTTTGTVTLTGDWTNSGTFTSNTGTVNFNGASGTQTVISGGAVSSFYNFTHSNASTLVLSTNPIDVNNNFSNTIGAFNQNGLAITVGKNWTNTAVFTPGTGTVTFDGSGQSISGSATFYNFTKQIIAPADTMTFDNTSEQTITHLLTLKGAASNLLSLRSDSTPSQWDITLVSGGAQAIQYVDVKDSNAGNGVTLVAGLTSTNSFNNINWNFGAATITWDGSASLDWDDPFNWDLGLVPTSADTVIIPSGPANQPALSTNVVVNNLTINDGASLTLAGKNLTVSGTFANGTVGVSTATVIAQGTETLTFTGGMDTDSGTFRYAGDGGGSSDTRTLTINASTNVSYFGLTINDPNGTPANRDVFATSGSLTVNGTLTATSGTLNASTVTNTIDANNVSIGASGILIAPASTGAAAFTVSGNWTNSGGTFTPSAGRVTLDGASQSISGSTTFYALSKDVAVAGTLTFDNLGTQTITNNLVLTGNGAGNRLSLRSDSDGVQWGISLQPGGTQMIEDVDVKDSDASPASGLLLVARGSSVDAAPTGTNTNWSFGGTTFTWDGSASTDWNTLANWDLGLVPSTVDTVIIPSGPANQPVLATDVTVTNLTINDGANMTLAGNDLTVSGTFANGTAGVSTATLILTGAPTEVVTFTGGMDTNSGTFRYVGDGGGSSDSRILTINGSTTVSYFGLTINDPNGTPANRDVFATSGSLTVNGTLTATSGTLNAVTATNTIDANNVSIGASGILIAPASTGATAFTVSGDWTNSGGTFTPSAGRVTLDGASQSISGSTTTFYALTKAVTANATLTLASSVEQEVANDLVLTATTGNVLTIASSGAPAAQLTLTAGGTQTISNVSVSNNDASGTGGVLAYTGVTLVARNTSTNGGTNINWQFGAATLTWDGSTSTDWNTASNWDLGLVPLAGDTVIIANAGNQPATLPLASAISVGTLTVNASATLNLNTSTLTVTNGLTNAGTMTLNGNNLTVSTSFSNTGNVNLTGTELITFNAPAAMDTDTGTFTYVGDGSGASDTRTLTINGSTNVTYNNLVINDPNGTVANRDVFATSGSLTANGTITVTSGTLNAVTATNTINANGSVSIGASGILIAPASTSATAFTVAGNWTNAGTFTNSSGKVTFDDSGQSTTFTGNTTFFDFNSTTASEIMLFTAGSTQTVNGTFNLLGSGVNKIVLDSTVAGSKWSIAFPNGGQTVVAVNVQDSDALNNTVTCFGCINGGNNNANWVFGNLEITVPANGRTVGPTPVIIGISAPSTNVTIKDISDTVVATAVADANGNFRVKLGDDQASLGTVTSTSLSLGANALTPYFGAIPGTGTLFTVVASPTTAQVPTIVTPVNNSRLTTATPTLTGLGKASETVTIMAKDDNGNLLLSNVGTGAVDAGGSYSATASTALPHGRNRVSVIVDGVSSEINMYLLTDPFGYVFDSVTSNTINSAVVTVYKSDGTLAVPGVDLDSTDVNPYTTTTDGFYSFLAANGNYYMTVSAEGYTYPSTLTTFPGGRIVINGSKGDVFIVAGVVQQIDHPVDGSPALLRIEKTVNKKEVKVGDVVTYTVTIQSLATQNSLINVFLNDRIPPGFKYLPNRVLLNGVPSVEPLDQRPLSFDVGTFIPGQTKTLRYQLVVGAGVAAGDYENVAFAKYSNGIVISNRSTATVKVIIDPLFDAGTLIGKVFMDLNENGRQDGPEYDFPQRENIVEKPVPNVQLLMEDGTVITTDKNGQFSLPGVIPGRHLLRVDERTLPAGAYFTTDKVAIIDVSPGLMTKVNFGVNVDTTVGISEDTQFFNERIQVTQEQNKPAPRLHVDLFNGELRMYNGILLEPAEFRIFLNYAPFIDSWKLDVIDRDTKRLVKRFQGNRSDVANPIYWDGRGQDKAMVREDRNYSYVLYVEDAAGHQDSIKEKPLVIRVIKDEAALQAERDKEKPEDYAKRYQDWLEASVQANTTQFNNIPIDGETVRVNPQNADVRMVRVMKGEEVVTEIPVGQSRKLVAKDLAEGSFKEKPQVIEFILPKGEYDLQVLSAPLLGHPRESGDPRASDGSSSDVSEGTPAFAGVTKYSRKINVGTEYLTFVAMGDGKVGYNFDTGNIEPIQSTDHFNNGFYNQGKLAYFLKGKVKGKYLITSSFDSEREKKALFRTLDKETYYPVYGDTSTTNYQATNTQGPLYLLVEWDKSSAIWGNYAVDFNNSEFASFSRSYYGGKIAYETVAQTPYSDPRTKIVVFNAMVKQRAAHTELLGTGGSLYYLKHKDLIEGSDRVRLEVRDQVTGLVVASKSMIEGADYEVDYEQGRILFWQPVAMLAQTERLIGNGLIHGNPVYVIADYEYSTIDKIAEASQGTRVQQAVSDNVTAGVTYVKETQEVGTYELQGYDTTVHLGKDAKVKAEYAQTESQDTGSFISTDGGLSYTELSVGNTAMGKAYGITGDARLFDRVGLQAYYKWIENGFASVASTSQQGKELVGFAMTMDMTPETRLTMRQDIQRLINNTNAQAQLQVGAEETVTTAMQIVHEARRLRLTAEFQNQQVTNKNEKYETVSATDTSTVAGRADYALTPKTDVSIQQEMELTGEKGKQTTVGATTQLTDHLAVRGTQSMGTKGTASSLGATANTTGKLALSTDYTQARDKDGVMTDTTTLGAATQLTDKIALNSSVARSSSSTGETVTTATVGSQASTGIKVDDADVSVAVGVAQSNSGKRMETANVGVTKQVDEDTAVSSSVNVSMDEAANRSSSLSLGAAKKVDDKTDSTAILTVDDSGGESQSNTMTFTERRKLNDDYQALVERSIGTSDTESRRANKYAIVRDKDGRKLEGSLTRQFGDSPTQISQSNIFGLSGDINDRWALLGSLEKGNVQNLDGSVTTRTALATGVGYVGKDSETGEERVKSSTKVELRLDSGNEDQRQFVLYNANEGKITDEATIFSKFEYSSTTDTTNKLKLAGYKEIVLGAAYRPIAVDRLNLIARYTYQENKSPVGQVDTATVDQERSQVFSGEAIYDINERWQLAEKLAYRINEEKIVGFEFNKTHTWLMVHRLNYNIDRNWQAGAEYRKLTQVEAKDSKQGFLLEATRKINDFAKLGAGYNFTTFSDDLTNLSYTVQGPFLRVTGSAYDRTPEERQRARAKWLEERVSRWAWKMVYTELERPQSKVVRELNQLSFMADAAARAGRLDESKQIYTDIVMAGQMMFEEAAEFIRGEIAFEEKMQEYNVRASDYFNKGELLKARQLWETVVEEVQK